MSVEPIETDPPCGPDLYETGDPEAMDFYQQAQGLLRERYWNVDDAGFFTPKPRDLKALLKTGKALTKRSHDLRILGVMARVHAVNRDVVKAAACLRSIADLLAAFGEEVHPQPEGSGAEDRRAALNILWDNPSFLVPLQNANLASEAEVTYRHHLASTEAITGRTQGEKDAKPEAIARVFQDPYAQDAGRKAQRALLDISQAAVAIQAACAAGPKMKFTLDIQNVEKQMTDMLAFLEPLCGPIEIEEPVPQEPAEETLEPLATPTVISSDARSVTSHDQARQVLGAVLAYFVTHEPSSPAIVALTQARKLIGRPLTEALEALLPEAAGNAKMVLRSNAGFHLSMSRMQELTRETLGTADPVSDGDAESDLMSSRADAVAALAGAQSFIQTNEPTSPVPLLVERALADMNKSFEEVVRDLVGHDVSNS